ncbi:MAG: hypothetical protein HY719_13540, partial [Planctomycetes bacterium]|nr:hypothetical protein [Planctomycetota bacterium]
DQGGVPLIEGRDVVPFHVLPARKRLRVNAPLPAGGYCRVAPPDRYGPGKVLVRQTAGWPVAAVDREGRCFRNSCLAIYPPEGLPAHFLAAWLNSSPARRLWREMFPESRQRAFPQVKVGYLRALPVPRADAPTRRRLAALARRIEAGLALLTPEAAARLARDGDSPGANSPAGAAFRDQAVARRVRAARAEIDRLFAALVGA